MCSSWSSPAPPGKSMRRTPAPSPLSVPRTLAGLPSCSSTQRRISSWSVVVVLFEAMTLSFLGSTPRIYPLLRAPLTVCARPPAWRDAGGDPDERPKPFCKLEAVFCERHAKPLPPRAEPAPLESPIVPLAGDELGWALAPLDALVRRARRRSTAPTEISP